MIQRISSFVSMFAIVFALAVSLPTMVCAEEEGAATEAEESLGDLGRMVQLEEVIVTAQKKEESLQSAPISIEAFTADSLQKQKIEGMADLQAQVPNFEMSPFPTGNKTMRLVIRGIGPNGAQITQDPGVGVYFDGVYIGRPLGIAVEAADLERVEVLRGPQGTLYGRNTIGGAVNFITARPSTEELYFKQTIGAGNRDYLQSVTKLNIPITDTLAVKGVLVGSKLDGWVDNPGPGWGWGDEENLSARFDLRWFATDAFTLDYGFDYSHVEAANYTYQAVTPGTGPLGFAASNYVTFEDDRVDSLTAVDSVEPQEYDIMGNNLTLTWDYADTHTLKSITSYRTLEESQYADLSSGATEELRMNNTNLDLTQEPPLSLGASPTTTDQWQVSQEFQFLGDAFSNQVDYVAGLYYFKEEADLTLRSLPEIYIGEFLGAGTYFASNKTDDTNVNSTSLAAYGQATYTPPIVEDRLHFTFGLRYSIDEREVDRDYLSFVELTGTVLDARTEDWESSPDQSFSSLDPSFTLAYDVGDSGSVYGKVVSGYKSGGFNIREADKDLFDDGFDEENIVSYELGAKGEFFDRRLRTNFAAFYLDYEDMQMGLTHADSPTTTTMFNAGKSHVYGFELDLTAMATEGLMLNLNYGYLKGEFDEVINPLEPEKTADDYVFARTPEHSVVIGGEYTFPPLSWGTFIANLSYSWTDETPSLIHRQRVEDNDLILRSYGLLNGRLTLADVPVGNRSSMRFALWGKNLLDEEYEVDIIDNLPQADHAVLWGDARRYGFEMVYEFGG